MTCPPSDEAFTAATHAELAELVTQARALRRNTPAHKACLCHYCHDMTTLHARIDDHLDQLEGKPPAHEPNPLLSVAFHAPGAVGDPAARLCGTCGRSRYVNTRGARWCFACDGQPAEDQWTSLDMDGAE